MSPDPKVETRTPAPKDAVLTVAREIANVLTLGTFHGQQELNAALRLNAAAILPILVRFREEQAKAWPDAWATAIKRAERAEAALAAAEVTLSMERERAHQDVVDMQVQKDMVEAALAAAEQERDSYRERWIEADAENIARAFLARPDGAPPQKSIPMALQAACGCTFHHDHKWCGSSLCECSESVPPQKAEPSERHAFVGIGGSGITYWCRACGKPASDPVHLTP